MYARWSSELGLYTVEWNGLHADSIDDRVLIVVAHALRSVYDRVTLSYSRDKTIATLIAYDCVNRVAAHLDLRMEKEYELESSKQPADSTQSNRQGLS
jgi:hypothetical protein